MYIYMYIYIYEKMFCALNGLDYTNYVCMDMLTMVWL